MKIFYLQTHRSRSTFIIQVSENGQLVQEYKKSPYHSILPSRYFWSSECDKVIN